jgi:DNA-nicking Smr family endonuclease
LAVSSPRGLSAGEAALWRRVTATVKPLNPLHAKRGEGDQPKVGGGVLPEPETPIAKRPTARTPPPPVLRPGGPPPHASRGEDRLRLDSSWERKLARAAIAPDFTLDLHGHTLDQAHARLDAGLAQARAMGARLVLLVTGRPRAASAADRGTQRGAIRANVLDWLAAGPHASDIAAIRKAHRRHGGDGALYVVLRRLR